MRMMSELATNDLIVANDTYNARCYHAPQARLKAINAIFHAVARRNAMQHECVSQAVQQLAENLPRLHAVCLPSPPVQNNLMLDWYPSGAE